MVPPMPVGPSNGFVMRLSLATAYLLLVLLLNPLLLSHALAADPHQQHSDRDVCAWLDHASATAIPVVDALPRVDEAVALVSLPQIFLVFTDDCYVDPIRGPPLSR